jgi:hypothetical protein
LLLNRCTAVVLLYCCRAALLSDLSSKDDVVRDMQAALDNAQHQLNLLDHDNSILREQLRILKGGSLLWLAGWLCREADTVQGAGCFSRMMHPHSTQVVSHLAAGQPLPPCCQQLPLCRLLILLRR